MAISSFLQSLVFLNPWILTGLLALPALWFLLRVTPPAPRQITLPTVRFLHGLLPPRQTPSRTPWWLLLLRLFIAALVITALAGPVRNLGQALPDAPAIRLVIDNDWAAASSWNEQIQNARDILARADREEKPVTIITTAPDTGQNMVQGPMSAAQASGIIGAIKPYPWPANLEKVQEELSAQKEPEAYTYWLGHGLNEGGFKNLATFLQEHGGLSYTGPSSNNVPLMLSRAERSLDDINALSVKIMAPVSAASNLPLIVQAVSKNGRVLDEQRASFEIDKNQAIITFDLPDQLRGEVSMLRLPHRKGAGSLYLLNEGTGGRSVGIIGPEDESETKPFIEAHYYLIRALQPFAELHLGGTEKVLSEKPSMIILPDTGALPPDELDKLENWVKDGGLLLRFAGPKMSAARSTPFLTPVPLRGGERSLQGALSWEKPQKLAAFSEDSPLFGIKINDDIYVRRQILAEPVQDLDKKTWARLEDGTPLITAAPLDQGLLVMVHTTAAADWSDLALSGTYVEILKRLLRLSGTAYTANTQTTGTLQPLWVLDGMGQKTPPGDHVLPIPAADISTTIPSPEHPPGLYGRTGYAEVLNIGDHIAELKTANPLPSGAVSGNYDATYEINLMPHLLYAALGFMLLDWLIMLLMMFGLKLLFRFACIGFFFVVITPTAQAQEADLKYTEGLYLAYVPTGNAAYDATVHKGLENMAYVLKRRTSAEPVGIAALDPVQDPLMLFPLIYWPVSAANTTLNGAALKNIRDYLDHGGTILFDTHEPSPSQGNVLGAGQSENMRLLRNMLEPLNIPPLAPVDKNHVLGRSFYLLESFPGRYEGADLWVETKSATGRDGVSSVIIGSHDWAGGWALSDNDHLSFGASTRKQELSYRFGVNLMMYALTGNYKADQVHVPYILERLGQ